MSLQIQNNLPVLHIHQPVLIKTYQFLHTYLVFHYKVRRYSLANPFLLSCYFENDPIACIFFYSHARLVSCKLRTYMSRRASILFRIVIVRACVRARTYINLIPSNSLFYYAPSNTRFVSANQFNTSIVQTNNPLYLLTIF